MNLYFDTNVYNFISACNEARAVRRFLDASGHKVLASSGNLFEIYAIPEALSRSGEVATLTTVAAKFESHPQSWFHADEVRREIKRCRPNWLRAISYTKKARRFLEGHHQRWEDAKALKIPPSPLYAIYRRDFETGVSRARQYQKLVREDRLKEKYALAISLISENSKAEIISGLDLHDPEIYWRVDCLQCWFEALVARDPASRDYTDWLDPYLRRNAFIDSSYINFWLNDVKPENMPRNRLLGLIGYYQTHHKIGHGNSEDQIHAGNLLDVDFFFTADRAFHAALQAVAPFFPGAGRPLLLNRGASSALQELIAAVDNLSQGTCVGNFTN